LSKPIIVTLIAGACLAVSSQVFSFRGWSDVFPPLTVEDVEALGAAADQVDREAGDGVDGTAAWENSRTGTFGTVQGLGKTERSGRYCRVYRIFIKVQGYEPYHAEPVMCKADDGKWKFAAGT